jgi:hypothetical protein
MKSRVLGALLSVAAAGAGTMFVAAPADASVVFPIRQDWPRLNVPSGTPATVIYSWPGGGAKLVTSWGDGTGETHEVAGNSRQLTHTWHIPCNEPSRQFVVFTRATKGNGDHGSAAIKVTVTSPNNCG